MSLANLADLFYDWLFTVHYMRLANRADLFYQDLTAALKLA